VSKKLLRRHREWKLERLIGGLIRVLELTIVDHYVADNWADIARYVPPRTYRPTKCLQTQHFGSLSDTTRRKMPPRPFWHCLTHQVVVRRALWAAVSRPAGLRRLRAGVESMRALGKESRHHKPQSRKRAVSSGGSTRCAPCQLGRSGWLWRTARCRWGALALCGPLCWAAAA
jgi:hypothetical protein